MRARMEPRRAVRDADDEPLAALMMRYQRGEMEAFEELYGRTLPMIRGYLLALTRDSARAADLVQECFLQVHRSRHTYDPALPVKPWLIGIARHVRLTDSRRRFRLLAREPVGLDAIPELPVPAEMDGWADREVLVSALAALPADRREALVLHHIYGLSFREIARVVGTSEGGARIRASRAMTELRERLLPGGRRG
jgi:RNA polymerase sigma-70 factor (ECF subfamily)